jgi:hypothetical protein
MSLRQVDKATVSTDSLHSAVDAASRILAWTDDWDGEGSPGYQAATLERARTLLIAGASHLWDVRHSTLPVPRVTPGPDGSIDLHWRVEGRELLLNIPAEEGETISFYGDDARTKVKGEIDRESDANWLFAWLARER